MLISYAHLNTIQTILNKWNHVTIGILNNDTKPNISNRVFLNKQMFYKLCEENWVPEKCIFSVEERIKMWKATISEYKIDKHVDVVAIERPEYASVKFNKLFPETNYDLLFPKPTTNEESVFDLIRNECFSEILQRKVFEIEPELTIHTTDIKNKIYEGVSNWDEFMPQSALQLFNHFNGNERMFNGDQKKIFT